MNNELLKAQTLFGLDKEFLIKNQLLRILDNSTTYLTTAELTNRFFEVSQDTIQQACRTLKSDIELLYSENECRLIIHQRYGIKLVREQKSLKKLLNYYIQQELSFILLRDLLLHRELISYDFLEESHVSESTLRRKIKTINRSLNKYELHITYAQKIRIVGTEVAIRSFYFLFLFLIYRQISTADFIVEPGFFESRGNKIRKYLNLSLNLKDFDVFMLVYYAHEHGVHTGIPLRLSDDQKKLFNHFEIPSKPIFLNNWSLDDWQFFLLFLSSSNLFEESFSVKYRDHFLLSEQKETQAWIDTYEPHFQALTVKEKEFVQQTIAKSLVFQSFILIEDELFRLFEMVDLDSFNQLSPYYFGRFQSFWEEFRYLVPSLDCQSFQFTSLMLSVYLSPLDVRLHELTLCIYTEFSVLFKNFLQERLVMQFKMKYSLAFTNQPAEADLIISTLPLFEEELTKAMHIIIEPFCSSNDLERIDTKLQTIIQNQNSNHF
ncbi:MAG: helix-turn-helix domain-containing protein [Enterococcus sp.]|nr:helix-turn-helix domain-containing protein [Enterococcus sp.]